MVGCGAAVSACYPASPTPDGRQARALYDVFFVGGAIVVVLIWVLLAWVVIRYRRRDDRLPRQDRGSLPIQVAWAVIPLVVVLGLFALTFQTMSQIQATSPAAGVNVHVWAFRWQWRFDYPDNGITIIGTRDSDPEIVVPVNTPVAVTLDAVDVNHSFYVPLFLFKRDAIPGMTNRFDFTVEAAGTYRGQCAEFCGVFHDAMLFSVRAVSAAEFEQWVAGQAQPSLPPPPLIGPAPYSSGR